MTPGTRRTLQIVGPALVAVGLLMFVAGPLLAMREMARVAGSDSFPDMGQFFQGFAEAAALSMASFLFLAAGGTLAFFGFRKSMAELAATDTAPAVEHMGAAIGRGVGTGVAEAGHVLGGVRVRCRACGFLDSEDARFCSQCRAAM